MTRANKAIVNFAGGEASPSLVARADLPLFQKIMSRVQNWIVEPQGPTHYRNGFVYVHHTRRNNAAVLIPFQFSDIQAYLIEATAQYFRFYKTTGLVLESAKTITGITQANPGVITSNSHGYSTGDEVYLSDIGGMTELNNQYALVVRINANTYSLTDLDGNAINTTGYTAYTSGGTTERVYEVKTPYREADLEELQYAQNADVMYITHRSYEPRKLTRTSDTSWSLARYVRTAEPFLAAKSIMGATQANPGVLTVVAHGGAVGDEVYIDGVVGMTELNDTHYLINSTPTADTLTLKTTAGVPVDTSGFTAYVSGGKFEYIGDSGNYPGAVAFTDDARLAMAGTDAKPETIWFSKSPTAAGAVQFDNFTTGSGATDAVIFTLAPLNGKVDSIRWLTNTDKYIAAGTFGSVRRIYGPTEAEPIGPDGITAKAANADGAQRTPPVQDGSTLFYIQRGGLSLQSVEYDYTIDGYAPDDKNLVSSHLTRGGFKQVVRQIARPTIIWVVKNDGMLLGLTYKGKENIAGWHRHKLGGNDTGGQVKWAGIMPRESNQDQIWVVVERTIDGVTRRYIEYMADEPEYPDLLDFFTEETAKEEDFERYLNYLFEKQKEAIHLDACSTYDGSSYGTDAGASITFGEDADINDQEDVTVTASAAVFTSDMVGREIWGKYTSEGIGGGRFEITEFVSTTVVKGTILDSFPATATYDAGDWFITATEVTGLGYLEGEIVGVVADGAFLDLEEVEDGAITIDEPASIIHVGLRYLGLLRTMPLDQGGVTGPAQAKNKVVTEVALRFQNASGIKFGTNPYNLQQFEFRRASDITGRPIPLVTGIEKISYPDNWEEDKMLVVIQDSPLPCTIAGMDVFTETADE